MRPRFIWQPELRDAPRERNEPEVPEDLASAAQRAADVEVENLVELEPEPAGAGASDAPLTAPNEPVPEEAPRRFARGAIAAGVLLGITAAFLVKPQKPDSLLLDRGLGERASEITSRLDRPRDGPAPPAPAKDEDHQVLTVLDLDAVGAPAASANARSAPRARPRVSIEYRPYRSVPLRPGEKSIAFPPVPAVSAVRP